MTSAPIKNALITSKFPYKPLHEPDSIRLVHLMPASSREAEIHCELVQTTITLCTDIYDHYTALSYVWGDPKVTKTIWLDGIPLVITVNLYSALRDLRHERTPLPLWTDAICINQSDDEEKLKQIALMGKIYAMAIHTVIYLGPFDGTLQDVLAAQGLQFSSEICSLILSQKWFRRVWIFQELVFSKDPKIQIGRYRAPWNSLYQAITQSTYSSITEGYDLLSGMNRSREIYQQETSRVKGLSWKSQKEPDVTMPGLLRARRGLGVTNLKDMIFAHLGFASDGQALAQYINYSMSYTQVYLSFACYMINTSQYGQLFSELDGLDPSARVAGLPSWVPDWSTSSKPIRIGWHQHLVASTFSFEKPPLDSFIPVNVTCPPETHVFVQNNQVLGCIGAEFDIVARCSD